MDTKQKAAADTCRATAKTLTDINLKLLGVETRSWLYCVIQECAEACTRCAEECESESLNARPAMTCIDCLSQVLQCCKYTEEDDIVRQIKAACNSCMPIVKKLVVYG